MKCPGAPGRIRLGRRCIAFVPFSAPGGCPETPSGRTSLGLAGWTRCPAAAAQPESGEPESGQQGDVFCRNHREAACGIVLGLLNDQKLADDATASREMARMAGSYFASQYWSRLCGKKTPTATGPNSGVRSPVDSTGVRTPDVEPQP